MSVNKYNSHWLFLVCDANEKKTFLRQEICIFARESLSIGPSFTMRLHRPLHNVETFSRPKISSICKHFPACKDILTREATKHREKRSHKLIFPPKCSIRNNFHIAQKISLITRLLYIVSRYKYLFTFLCSINLMIKDTYLVHIVLRFRKYLFVYILCIIT